MEFLGFFFSDAVHVDLPINGGTSTVSINYDPSQRYYLYFRGTPKNKYLFSGGKVSCSVVEHKEPVVRPDNYLDFGVLTNSDLTIYQTTGSMKTVVERRSLFLDESFVVSLDSDAEVNGYIGCIVHHFRSPDYDIGTRVYYDLSIEYSGTGAMLQDARLLTESEKNIILSTYSTESGYVLKIGGYSDITSSFIGFDVVVDVAYIGLPLLHHFSSTPDTVGAFSYPLEDENEIIKGFDDVTNGYQNDGMDSSKDELNSSLAGIDNAENSLFNPAKDHLGSYEFVDINSFQGLAAGVTFVSTFLQSFYVSSGGLDGLGIITAVGFSVLLVSVVIGFFRYYKK